MPTIDQVLPKFEEFVGDALVAHNAAFDVGFIREQLRRRGKELKILYWIHWSYLETCFLI